ncbi:MAG TPA: nitrite reductase, copper-containing, partial [bacterium]|nr:nitrite reductase, copper-containing [bacterium]
MKILGIVLLLSAALAIGFWPASAPAAGPAAVAARLVPPPAVPPSAARGPARVIVTLETQEATGVLADGVQY